MKYKTDTLSSTHKNNLKDESYKVNIESEKYFGTDIWLVRTGHRANYLNYLKLYRAGWGFSGLFHINGNINYSVIELFKDYMLSAMEEKNFDCFNHLSTRLCSNLKEIPLNSQPYVSRKTLEELDLASCIVDDVMLLRK